MEVIVDTCVLISALMDEPNSGYCWEVLKLIRTKHITPITCEHLSREYICAPQKIARFKIKDNIHKIKNPEVLCEEVFESLYDISKDMVQIISYGRNVEVVSKLKEGAKVEKSKSSEELVDKYKIEESENNKQRRERDGYNNIVTVDAKILQNAIEKTTGEKIDWSKERLDSALSRKTTDSYPLVDNVTRGVDITDGGHRIAAAARKGQTIDIAIKDSNLLNKINELGKVSGTGIGKVDKRVNNKGKNKSEAEGKTLEEYVASQAIFSEETTGMSYYDNLFGPRGEEIDNVDKISQKEYYKINKNVEGDVVYMSPDEYIDTAARGQYEEQKRINPKITYEEFKSDIEGRRVSKESLDKIRNAIKEGKKINIPHLEYTEEGLVGQEGYHRAIVAKELGLKQMPVLLVREGKAKTPVDNLIGKESQLTDIWDNAQGGEWNLNSEGIHKVKATNIKTGKEEVLTITTNKNGIKKLGDSVVIIKDGYIERRTDYITRDNVSSTNPVQSSTRRLKITKWKISDTKAQEGERDTTFVEKMLEEPPAKPIGPSLKDEKGELRIAGENLVASELVKAYERQKDIWIGNKDVRTVLEIPSEKKQLQTAIKGAAGEKSYGDLSKAYDMAIQLYIDSKNNPKQVEELYDTLTDEQKALIDLSQSLPPEIKKVADEISNIYSNIGTEALDAEVIRNVIENYAARLWDFGEGKTRTENFRKFGTSTKHSKQRKLSTIVEGWSKGMNLSIKGATNNLALLKEEIVKTIEDKKMIDALKKITDVDGNSLLTTKQLDGYKKVEHPNFKTWQWAGKVEPSEDQQAYGRNFFVTEDGTLFERKDLYAPEAQANNLNNILGISKLKGIKAIDTLTKYNANLKAWILQTSLFHHMAFLRSYYLGTNRKTFKEMNLIDAVNEGNKMIDELDPVIVLGVRNGLTVGRKQDWDESLLQDKTFVDSILDQSKASKAVKEKIFKFRKDQADFLFGVVGSGLKAKAFAIEYRNQIKKYPNEDVDAVAKRVASLINDDFGGLHLQRMGRNPTLQHIFRLLALAPDWTESNIRTMIKAVKAGGAEETKMYRHFWAGIIAKGLTATVLANLATAAFDEDDNEGQGTMGRFYRNYKRAAKEGRYLALDVDITPIYKAFGGTSNERYYFSLLGHFKDPIRFILRNEKAREGEKYSSISLGNAKAMKNKASVLAGMLADYVTGTDYAERRFTTAKELAGIDKEKGAYKTSRRGKYRRGDPKWGKLVGQTVTWDPTKKGIVELEQLPSFILNKAKSTQPIQVQQILGYAAGELSGFMTIMNALGLGVKQTYGND